MFCFPYEYYWSFLVSRKNIFWYRYLFIVKDLCIVHIVLINNLIKNYFTNQVWKILRLFYYRNPYSIQI